MKSQSIWAMLARIGGVVILLECLVLTLAGLIGWRRGWQTPDEYGLALQIAGLLAIGIGTFGVKGNLDATRSFGYQYSLSATEQSSWERTQLTLLDLAQSYAFMLVMFAVGGLSILIGWML
jgi:hypothetical protein